MQTIQCIILVWYALIVDLLSTIKGGMLLPKQENTHGSSARNADHGIGGLR